MYPKLLTFAFMAVMLCLSTTSVSQQRMDSIRRKTSFTKESPGRDTASSRDTTAKKPRSNASKAALRAAILPGWGQIYNKKYWKLPLVYGALAIPVVTFNFNVTWYRKTREAYTIRYYNDTSRVSDLPLDPIDPQLIPLSTGSLRNYRNSFRQNVDYSVLAFLLMWGLQIVDATVDAHLKSFNINDDLSLKIRPIISPVNTNGLSLIFTPREPKPFKQVNGF